MISLLFCSKKVENCIFKEVFLPKIFQDEVYNAETVVEEVMREQGKYKGFINFASACHGVARSLEGRVPQRITSVANGLGLAFDVLVAWQLRKA